MSVPNKPMVPTPTEERSPGSVRQHIGEPFGSAQRQLTTGDARRNAKSRRVSQDNEHATSDERGELRTVGNAAPPWSDPLKNEVNEMADVDVIARWVGCFNNHDAAGCAALYADDAVLHVAFVDPVQGREAIRGMFDAYFSTAPLHCTIKRLYAADGGHVVLEWQDKVGLLGVNIYELAHGLIQNQRNYFDQVSFLRLNGLPMPRV